MSKNRETPRGKIRVQIPGYAWLDALKESFVADNEGWFEQRRQGERGASYVAFLDPEVALMLAHRLEGRAPLVKNHQRSWALRRIALRIEADVAVLRQEEQKWPL